MLKMNIDSILLIKESIETLRNVLHNQDQLKNVTMRLNDPIKREIHNERQYALITKKREDPTERANHNERRLELVTQFLK